MSSKETHAAALIADIVASRSFEDQPALMARVSRCLSAVNALIHPRQTLALTLGDEFQGAYARLDEALRASTLLALSLTGRPWLRIGIGWGDLVAGSSPGPAGQSGSAWWRARDAIGKAKRREGAKGWPRSARSAIETGEQSEEHALSAFLVTRDHLLGRMDEKDMLIALGLMQGRTQEDIAKELGIAQPNVSRRNIENGPAALIRAHEALEGSRR